MTIISLFNHSFINKKDKVALEFKDQTYTFGMLNTRSNKMARTLLKKGLISGDRLCVYVENSVEAEMLNARQMSIPAACHSRHWRSAQRSPHWVSGSISPWRSANGTKRDGGTLPSTGSSQRTSASTRLSFPSVRLILGW